MTNRRDWMQTDYRPFKKKRRPPTILADTWLARTGAFGGDLVAIKKHLDNLRTREK